jgi:DnaJ family protein C protein 11
MLSRSGMGGGNLMGTIRHTLSPQLSGEVSVMMDTDKMIFILLLVDYYFIKTKDMFIKNILFTLF